MFVLSLLRSHGDLGQCWEFLRFSRRLLCWGILIIDRSMSLESHIKNSTILLGKKLINLIIQYKLLNKFFKIKIAKFLNIPIPEIIATILLLKYLIHWKKNK